MFAFNVCFCFLYQGLPLVHKLDKHGLIEALVKAIGLQKMTHIAPLILSFLKQHISILYMVFYMLSVYYHRSVYTAESYLGVICRCQSVADPEKVHKLLIDGVVELSPLV